MTVFLRRFGSLSSPVTCSCHLTTLSPSRWVKWAICARIPTSIPVGRRANSGQSLPQPSLHCLWTQEGLTSSLCSQPRWRLIYPMWAVLCYCWVVVSTGKGSTCSLCSLALTIQSLLFSGCSILDFPKSSLFISYSESACSQYVFNDMIAHSLMHTDWAG